MTGFFEKVWDVTKRIPSGKVASYGMIAAMVSTARAARQVGWALHSMPKGEDIPWHRVINSRGYISTTCDEHTCEMQKALLEAEGVEVTRKDGMWRVDLGKYLWKGK